MCQKSGRQAVNVCLPNPNPNHRMRLTQGELFSDGKQLQPNI